MIIMTNFKDFLEEQLKDPKFRSEYDALEPEFFVAQAVIDASHTNGEHENVLL